MADFLDDAPDAAPQSDADKLAALGLTSAGVSTTPPSTPAKPSTPSPSSPNDTDTRSTAMKAWDFLTKTPDWLKNTADEAANSLNEGATGEHPFLDTLRGFAAGALQGATRAYGNPVGAATALAGFPEESVALPAAKAVIRGAQAVAGTAAVPEGIAEAMDPTESTLDRFAGGGKAALGALSAVLGLKGLMGEVPGTADETLPAKTYPSTNPAPAPGPANTVTAPAGDMWPDISDEAPKGPITRSEQLEGLEPLRAFPKTPQSLPADTTPAPPPFTDRSVQAFRDMTAPTSTPEPLDVNAPPAGEEPSYPASLNRVSSPGTPTDAASGATTPPDLITLNGSGDSAASMEAINRNAGMQARGEQFVKYDRTGQRTPLIGVDAVDYHAQPGETYGVEGPNGFQVLDDNGGRVPAVAQLPAELRDAIAPDLFHGHNDLSASSDEPFDLGRLESPGASGGGPGVGGTPDTAPAPVHPAIQALYNQLLPQWHNELSRANSATGTLHAPFWENLQDFAHRLMTEEDPRQLMGAERKARVAALAGDETGAISPTAAIHLASGALGGAVGAADQPEHPVLGAAVGAGIGGAAPLLVTHPAVAQALRYLNLLSSPITIGKKVLGDMAGAGKAMFDTASEGGFSPTARATAGRIGKEFFSPQTVRDAVQNIKTGPSSVPTGTYGAPETGVLGLTNRVYGGITDAAKSAYARAGVPELADKYTYTGDPTTSLGKAFMSFANKSGPIGEAALPFTRVATNIAEQGTQAIPGVGFVPLLGKLARGEDVSPSEWAAAGIKQLPGTAAVLAGKEAADAEQEKGTPTSGAITSRLGTAAAGPYQVPYEVAKAMEKTHLAAVKSKTGGTPAPDAFAGALWDNLMPIAKEDLYPSNLLTQAVPSVLPEIARLAGEEPRSFNTHSLLGPTIARIPGLNELMLTKSTTYHPPPAPLSSADAAKLAALGLH